MKKLLYIFLLFFTLLPAALQAQQNIPCCPDFTLESNTGLGKECCMSCNNPLADTGQSAIGLPPGPGSGCRNNPIVVCKNSYAQISVYPNLPGFSYSWTITGGNPTSVTGNPITILWGSNSTGSIKVVITSADGKCVKIINRAICFLDKPSANFTYMPSANICTGTVIQFNNTSAGGTNYVWDFGDGSPLVQTTNAQHQYSGAGTYTVTLVASNAGTVSANGGLGSCGCVDTIKKLITVNDGPGIETCKQMLCPGDTAEYCSTKTCSGYTWTVSGGTIVGPANAQCVKVIWNTAPGSLTLNTSGCGVCNTNTITPTVIWPTLPYAGPTTVCINSVNTYSLPVIPGTFYSWSVSPGTGATILNGPPNYPGNYPVNNPSVNVQFTQAGTYTLTCNYTNPNTMKKCGQTKDCGGTTNITITVKPRFVIQGLTSFCQNTTGTFNTLDFSPANWGITGPSGGYSPVALPNGPSINVNWLLPGTYTLTATSLAAANYCPPTSINTTITVNPTPVVNVSGSNTICKGSMYTYTVSPAPQSNISWAFTSGTGSIYPSGTNNASAQVAFTGSGPWTLEASQTVNGCTGKGILNITAIPAPTIPAAITTCVGGTVTLIATGGAPAGSYVWSSNPQATLLSGQGTNTAIYQINGPAGTTTVNVSACGNTSNNCVITITSPTASITPSGSGCSFALTASTSLTGTLSYQWTYQNTGVGSTNPLTGISNGGTYLVSITDVNGCKATAQTAIATQTVPKVTISPNGLTNYCGTPPPNVSLTLQAFVTSGVGCTFQWKKNGVNIPGATSTSLPLTGPAPANVGSYTIVMTCPGCPPVTSNAISVTYTPACPDPPGCIPVPPLGGPDPFGTISIMNCNPKTFSVPLLFGCSGAVTWNFGDGSPSVSSASPVTHTYNLPGNYTVVYSTTCNGCTFTKTVNVQVPLAADFKYTVNCTPTGWSISLDCSPSQYLSGWGGYTVAWSGVGGITPPNACNATLNLPLGSPSPNITLTISNTVGSVSCVSTRTINIPLPNNMPLQINPIANVCPNQSYTLSSNYVGAINYNWSFGDGATSTLATPQHAWPAPPPASYTVNLSVTDGYGCVRTASQTVTVINVPPFNINPDTAKICVGGATTLSASAGFSNYQWYYNGGLLSNSPPYSTSGNTLTITDNGNIAGPYVATAVFNGCVVKDTAFVVYQPKPLARIMPRNVQCAPSFPYNVVNIYSGNSYNPNYTYTWYLNNLGNQVFTSTSTNYLTYTVNAAGCLVFVVKVTDNTTGCSAYDTACICFVRQPTVSIAPPGPFCAGSPVTFTATALPPGTYTYIWQDGQQGANYTTSLAGIYTVTAINNYGCSATASTGIKPLPYVALFPQKCVTLCDTAHIYFPLPQTTFGGPGYTITWYEGANVIGSGFSIPVSALGSPVLGVHNIYAEVTMNGCTVKTNTLTVTVIKCTCCDCKGSHWGEITLTPETGGNPIQLACKQPITITNCTAPYTLNAAYFCADTACTGKVTYSLQPPSGSPVTGNAPLNYTFSQNGTYTLTLYGWCGSTICDSCIIDIIVNCTSCDCKESKWLNKYYALGNNGKKTPLECNATVPVKCNQPISVFAAYACVGTNCPGTVNYMLQPPTGAPITGSIPPVFTFTPTLPGTYTLTLIGLCGGKECDKCTIQFTTDCKPGDCCPKDLAVNAGKPDYGVNTNPAATIVSNNFTVTGLGSMNIVEVRANVISYTITDNYDKECLKCVNLPFTWASMASATNIGTAAPAITLFGGTTVPSFNGSGSAAYQNPREIIWNNGSNLNSPPLTNIGIKFILPPPPGIDCCELKGKICVKFVFRDKDCKECEAVACFDFVIKKK